MSLVSTEAFVINGFRYGETSKIVTFYSIEFGKFSAIVKGVRSFKSHHSGVFENMNLVNLHFNKKENRSLQVITKAECINSFKNIKNNLDKLNLAYQVIEIVNKTSIEYDTHKDIYFLLKDVFLLIEMMKNENELPLLLFAVKLAKLLGVEPIIMQKGVNNERAMFVSDGTFTIDKTLMLSDDEYNLLNLLRNYNFELNENINCNVYIVEKFLKLYESFFMQGFQKSVYLKTKKIKEELKRKI